MCKYKYTLPGSSEMYRLILDEFIAMVEERDLAEGLILFGSAARGEASPESDLDVLAIVSEDWYSKTIEFNIILRSIRETSAYKDLSAIGILPQIYPFYIERAQLCAPPIILCEILDHGVVIYDPRSCIYSEFERIKRDLGSCDRSVTSDGRIIWRGLDRCSTFIDPINQRLKLLDTAVNESYEEAVFSFSRGVYNLAIRRSQEAVELSMVRLLLQMGVHAPKDHDMGETLFEVLSQNGIHADERIRSRITQSTISLTRMRGHSMHQTLGYSREVAQEALDQARYILDSTNDLSQSPQLTGSKPKVLTICGSMTSFFEMRAAQERFSKVPDWVVEIPEINDKVHEVEIRKGIYKDSADIKKQYDCIKGHYGKVEAAKWILIYNQEKRNTPGYIGPNTFLEIGFAHILGKKLFSLYDHQFNTFMLDELNAIGITSLEGNPEKMICLMEQDNEISRPKLPIIRFPLQLSGVDRALP